jgi:hypothetical protein
MDFAAFSYPNPTKRVSLFFYRGRIMQKCIILSREHCLASHALEVAPRGLAARSGGALGGKPLRARQIDIIDAVLAALKLILESGGGWEIGAVEVRNATIEVARDERVLDNALASLCAGLKSRRRGCRGCRRRWLVLLLRTHAHAHAQTPAGVGGVGKEAQQGQGKESNKTGGLHGGLIFGRDDFANESKKQRQRQSDPIQTPTTNVNKQ